MKGDYSKFSFLTEIGIKCHLEEDFNDMFEWNADEQIDQQAEEVYNYLHRTISRITSVIQGTEANQDPVEFTGTY